MSTYNDHYNVKNPRKKTKRFGKLKKRVREALDYDRFEHYCRLDIEELMQLGEPTGPIGDQYTFIDNGSDILAVAHCDVVDPELHFHAVDMSKDIHVYCPRLDDRQGVYTILDMLPKLGVNVDILLTENEEMGRSTAAYFKTQKKYNWICEFDRCGDGCTMYQYNNVDMEDELTTRFGRVEYGSYTDIVDLELLGVCGVNVSVGYEDNHSWRAYASMNTYVSQMARFLDFYEKCKDIRFDHAPSYYGYNAYDAQACEWDSPAPSLLKIKSLPVTEHGYGTLKEEDILTADELDMMAKGPYHDCPHCNVMFGESETIRDSYGILLCPECGSMCDEDDSPELTNCEALEVLGLRQECKAAAAQILVADEDDVPDWVAEFDAKKTPSTLGEAGL